MTNGYWMYAQRKEGTYPAHASRGGKWLIFVSSHIAQATWNKVRTALEEGRLGSLAKASTAKHGPRSQDSRHGVICVYTYDWKDREDVERIREELRKMGITRKIPYKTDEDTERGTYSASGSEKISKYYE